MHAPRVKGSTTPMPIRHSKHVVSQAHEDDRNRYPVDALSHGHPTARSFHNAYFYYTTSGSFIGMRSQPNSVTCKQFIINQTSAQYTTAGSFIEGPKSRCDARGPLRSVGQAMRFSLVQSSKNLIHTFAELSVTSTPAARSCWTR